MRPFAVAIGIALLATAARAQSPTTTGLLVEEDEGGSRWGGLVIADSTLGFGTFVSSQTADDPFVAGTLSLRPSFRIDEIPGGAILYLRQDLQYEFTDPNNGTGRRFDYADPMFWLIAPSLLREPATGVQLGAEARLFVPLSYESRQADKIGATTLGLRLQRPFGAFLPQLRLLATKHFYARPAPVFDREDYEGDDLVSRHCTADACGGGAYLPSWSLTTYGALTWLFDERWNSTFVLQYASGWRHASPDDEFTSPNAQPGAARTADTVSAGLDLTFQYDERFSFSAGLTTTQPVRTADNASFRFPLLDVETPANNYSGFYFDVIASF